MAELFGAAECLSDVDFYITGKPKSTIDSLLKKIPKNCHLTGYLPYDKYISLLRGADLVIDLTNRDHTLLLGGFEAVSLGKPLIVSAWPVLREYFVSGTVFVPNTVEGISQGVRQAQDNLAALKVDMLCLRDQLTMEWEEQYKRLTRLLG
jgi:glycosyltransferase involved in cell wall biosynthesis